MSVRIKLVNRAGDYFRAYVHTTFDRLVKVFGRPNVDDDPAKVEASWGVKLDGLFIGIWCYKEPAATCTSWSVYYDDPRALEKLNQLLGN